MIFGRTLVLSLAALLIAAPNVFAQQQTSEEAATQQKELRQTIEDEATDPARSGPMFGLGAGYALDNFSGLGADPDGSAAYNAHIGYRFNPRFATELQIERYQPFVLIGVNYLKLSTTDTRPGFKTSKTDDEAAMRFGAGLDVYATDKLVVTTDISYMLGMGQVQGYDIVMFSLGFLFRP